MLLTYTYLWKCWRLTAVSSHWENDSSIFSVLACDYFVDTVVVISGFVKVVVQVLRTDFVTYCFWSRHFGEYQFLEAGLLPSAGTISLGWVWPVTKEDHWKIWNSFFFFQNQEMLEVGGVGVEPCPPPQTFDSPFCSSYNDVAQWLQSSCGSLLQQCILLLGQEAVACCKWKKEHITCHRVKQLKLCVQDRLGRDLVLQAIFLKKLAALKRDLPDW